MRRSGILLPIFSLPGDYGIGTLGKPAYDFVDFLAQSGQYYWQILPINPTAYGNSPYQSPCVFAGNPYFIDPDILQANGLLSRNDLLKLKTENTGKIDYGQIYSSYLPVIKKGAENISDFDKDFLLFKSQNSFWLKPYVEFSALKELNSMLPHSKWKQHSFNHESYFKEVNLHAKIQFLFFSQWLALKKYANAKGVHIIGDLPIYPCEDSSDYYFNKNLFLKDVSAACPPDSFSPRGQNWGNPIYDWGAMEKDNFFWWKQRLTQAQEIFDCVRIDHFRGIYEYYCVKYGSTSAVDGKWQKGPGMKFVSMIKENFPTLKIIAEDLGFLTNEVKAFFAKSGFAGMKVLLFAFDGSDNEHLPHNYAKNSVAYTGTHDNQTLKQFLHSATELQIISAMDYLGSPSRYALLDCFIRAVMASVSEIAIIPIQDWLALGGEGRINTPGSTENNWQWRINNDALSNNLTEKILNITKIYKRTKE